MVGSEIKGGLGNQLFQYAAGRALALRRGTELALDRRWYKSDPRFYLPYELHYAGVDAPEAEDHFVTIWEAQDYVFDSSVLDAPDGSILRGYWQSEKYFADAADHLRRELQPPGLRVPRSVSVHVRRGTDDLVADPALGLLTVEYYEAAVALVKEQAEVEHVFVFADDRDWAARNLPVGWHIATPAPGLVDFARMSRCENHVIANSSFSWWAAWLNPDPQKIVVAPTGFAEFDMPDFIPDSWTRLACAQ